MKLFNIFNEDWQTVRGYDRERYTELPGLEGPISTKSGKVLYYDKKEGKYYDRDTDMYLDHDDALAFLNEDFEAEFGFPLVEKDDIASTGKTQRILTLMRAKYPQAENDIEALLLHFDTGQARDRTDINRLGAENDAEEEEIDALQKELDKIKARRGIGEAESNKERAERAAIAKIQDQFKDMPKYKPQSAEERAKAHKEREERAMAKAKENADMLMKLADKHGESISASEVGYFAKGIADGKRGYSDPKAGDALGPNVYAYDAGVRVGEKLGASVNEDYYETDEQRELARLGRIIMDMGKKRDDDIGTAMGAVGNELTRYGTPQGVNSIQKLEKVTGQPESVIMKMMALAQKVQGDVAVGDDVPDEEIEEAPSTTDDAYVNQQRGMDMGLLGPKKDQPLVIGPKRSGGTSTYQYNVPVDQQIVRKVVAPNTPAVNQQLVTKTDKLKNIPFIGDKAASTYATGVAQDHRASQATKTAVAKPAAGTTPVTIPRIKGQPIDRTTKGLEKTQKGQMPMQSPDDMMAMGPDTVAKKLPKERVPRGADPLKIFNPKDKPAPAPKKQDDTTFAQAFRAARKAHGGPGGAFMWRGKKYQTNVKGEKYVKNPVLVQSKQYEDKSWSEVNKELGDKYGDDVGMNWNPKAPSLSGAAHTTYKYLTQPRSGDKSGQMKRNEVTESDWEENFIKRLKAKISGSPEVQAYLDLKAKQYGDQNLDLDPGAAEKGLAIGVLDTAKARRKASKKGVRAPGSLRASPNTRNPERLPEAESPMVTYTVPNVTFDMASKLERLAKEKGVEYSRQGRTVVLKGPRIDITSIRTKMGIAQTNIPMEPVNEAHGDIKIGDTVQTLKMGQMQGTVTGFSKKGGIDKVMFKHKSGKVYATVPDNLKVISSKKTESLNDDTVVEAKKKPVPTDPSKWSYYKSQAKKKFDVYPSAYANAWAAKQYKAAGGGWRMGKPKK
jgi:hypothetical protein